MKKNLLLVYTTTGPTSRERSVINIVDNLATYTQFDILLLTDYQADPIYDSVRHLDNIIIKAIDELRKDYPWSIQHEPLPIKTLSDEEYATYLVTTNTAIGSCFWRFAFLLDGIEKYDGVLFCNTDVVFTGDAAVVDQLEREIQKFTKSTVFGHGGYDRTEQYTNEWHFIMQYNNFQRKKDQLLSNDGNFFCYCFKSKHEITEFFNVVDVNIYNIFFIMC